MLDSRSARLGLVLLLLVAQAALFPLHATQPVNEDAWVLAGEEEFVVSPEQYVGDRVDTGGVVQSLDPLVIRVEALGGTHPVTITDTTLDPEVGDKVRAAGVLTAPGTIRATNAFVVPERGRWYAWGISFLAGVWVLGRLIRHWTVDWATLGFEPRETPLSLGDLRRVGREEANDA